MSWRNNSRRKQELPPNWPAIRRAVLERDDHLCQIRGRRCTLAATDVDHIGDRLNHALTNLRAACQPCHRERTSAQGHAAKPSRYRAAGLHPGLIDGGGVPRPSETAHRHV